MAVKDVKECSPSLAIREMQIKTTLRFYLIPVRMTKIKNSSDSRYCKYMDKEEHFPIFGEIANW